LLLGVAVSLGAFVCALGALLFWLTGTEAGLRWCVREISAFSAEAVVVDSARGRLIGPLHLEGLRLRTRDTTLEVAMIELDWRPRALLSRRLALSTVTLKDLRLTQRTASATTAGGLPALPLAVSIDKLSIDGIALVHPTLGELRLSRIQVEAMALDHELLWRRLTVQAPGLSLQARGGLRPAAAGQATWQLAWSLAAPDLSKISPTLSGRVVSEGALTGPVAAPHLKADVEAGNVTWSERSLAQARAHVDVDLRSDAPWRIDVAASELKLRRDLSVQSLTLTGGGRARDHELVLAAALPQARLSLHARGHYIDGQWQAELSDGRIETSRFGTWRQDHGSPLRAARGLLDLKSWCWTGGTARICGAAQWKRGQPYVLRATVDALPVARLPLFEAHPDVAVSGTIRGNAQISIDKGRIAAINATADIGPGQIRYPLGDGTQTTAYRQGRIEITGDRKNLDSTIRIALQAQDHASGRIRLPDWQEHIAALDNQSLRGELHFALSDFGLLPVFAPELAAPQGALTGNVTVAGTLGAPLVSGTAHRAQGGFELPRYGLTIKDIDMRLDAPRPSNVLVHGTAGSGEGRVNLNARISASEPGRWKGTVAVKGENFEVMRVPGQHILVSPDLNVAFAPNTVNVTGQLMVPTADIKLVQRQAEVQLSPDVVILDEKAKPPTEPALQITSHLQVKLGDKVHVQGYGFDGRLAGALSLTEKADAPALADGEIRVVKGSYAAYGQTLTVEDGSRLFYAGGPLADPGLDLRAVRQTDQAKVGILVRGRLREPQLSLYSDKPMSDSDMLSYLVLGRPYSAASAAQGALLYKAASSLGGAQSGGLVTNIAQRFGLSDVRIESGTRFQDTVVAVEKYLSPRLYLRYAIGLWGGEGGLRLRYKLSDQWTVEGSSGHLGGADILYTRER
jgi:translocation and assembly module TamB